VKTVTVSDAIGWVSVVLKKRLLNEVKSSGAVSPAMRASASTTPVRMPGSAAGSTTLKVACARVAPSASDPSRIEPGTRSSSSSVVRAMIGIIMMPSARPPASALNCFTGSTAIGVDEYADDDRRHAVERVGGKADQPTDSRVPAYSDR
jgi:hypothetical protein